MGLLETGEPARPIRFPNAFQQELQAAAELSALRRGVVEIYELSRNPWESASCEPSANVNMGDDSVKAEWTAYGFGRQPSHEEGALGSPDNDRGNPLFCHCDGEQQCAQAVSRPKSSSQAFLEPEPEPESEPTSCNQGGAPPHRSTTTPWLRDLGRTPSTRGIAFAHSFTLRADKDNEDNAALLKIANTPSEDEETSERPSCVRQWNPGMPHVAGLHQMRERLQSSTSSRSSRASSWRSSRASSVRSSSTSLSPSMRRPEASPRPRMSTKSRLRRMFNL